MSENERTPEWVEEAIARLTRPSRARDLGVVEPCWESCPWCGRSMLVRLPAQSLLTVEIIPVQYLGVRRIDERIEPDECLASHPRWTG